MVLRYSFFSFENLPFKYHCLLLTSLSFCILTLDALINASDVSDFWLKLVYKRVSSIGMCQQTEIVLFTFKYSVDSSSKFANFTSSHHKYTSWTLLSRCAFYIVNCYLITLNIVKLQVKVFCWCIYRNFTESALEAYQSLWRAMVFFKRAHWRNRICFVFLYNMRKQLQLILFYQHLI